MTVIDPVSPLFSDIELLPINLAQDAPGRIFGNDDAAIVDARYVLA